MYMTMCVCLLCCIALFDVPPSSSILFSKNFKRIPAKVAEVVAFARNEFGMIYNVQYTLYTY